MIYFLFFVFCCCFILFCVCSLFNSVFSISDCRPIASNDLNLVNRDLDGVGKGQCLGLIKVVHVHSSGGTEEHYEELNSW